MEYFPYAFTAPVEHHDLGTYRYTVVWLDNDVAAQLPLDRHPRLRVSGEIGDHPFTGAWQPSRGRWYLMLGKKLLKDSSLSVGAFADIRFRVEDQGAVEASPLLLRAIEADPAAATAWAALTPGKQRALSHRVLSAKSGPTVTKRVAEVIAWLCAGESDLRRLGKP